MLKIFTLAGANKKEYKNNIFFLSLAIALGASIGLFPQLSSVLFAAAAAVVGIFLFPFTAFLFLVFFLPFQPALNLTGSVDLASGRLLIIVLLAVWIVRGLISKNIKIPHDLPTIFLCSFVLWTFFSVAYSPVQERTLRKVLVFGNFLPLYFITYAFLKEKGPVFLFKIVKALAASSFVVSLFALTQFFAQFIISKETITAFYLEKVGAILWGRNVLEVVKGNPSWLFDAGGTDLLRAFATLPDPHILSFFLVFGVSAQLFLMFLDKRNRYLYLFWAVLGFGSFFLTFSRGGYLGFLTASAFILTILFAKHFNKKTIAVVTSTAIAGIIFLFVMPNPVASRLKSSFDVYEGSNAGRLEIWGQALGVFFRKPIAGVGLGVYSFELNPSASYRDPIYAHNLYLEFLAEIGLVGTILWLGIILITFYYLLRIFLKEEKKDKGGCENSEDEKKRRYLSLATLFALIWFSAHSFFEMPIYSPVILPLLLIFLAFASYLNETGSQEDRKKDYAIAN